MPRATSRTVSPHHEGGHAAGELHDLDAAPHLAASVPGVLAVLQRNQVPGLLEVLFQQHLETEKNPRPVHDRGGGPLREGLSGPLYRTVEVLASRERNICDLLARGRVVDRLGLASVVLLPTCRL
jgi:hypothetical protein